MIDNMGSIIKDYMKENGFSIIFLSKKTNIDYYKLTRLLNDHSESFPLKDYIAICDALDVTYDKFLY